MAIHPYRTPYLVTSKIEIPFELIPNIVEHVYRIWHFVVYHLYTAILFTWTDYKTIFLPITVFACATAPVSSVSAFLQAEVWIWIHLLLCNISNQAHGGESEDALNHPWRPLPSKRVTQLQTVVLRWLTVVVCLLWSASYGSDMVYVTLGLIVTTFLYDEGELAGHPVGKNLCNIGGYTTFELGATMIMGAHDRHLDFVSSSAVLLSGILIFTTIHAQDFSDIEGDASLGRLTFPIYAPELSRRCTLFALLGWSVFLPYFWSVGQVWLMFAHVFPLHARGTLFI